MRKKIKNRLIKLIILFALIFLTAAIGLFSLIFTGAFGELPKKSDLKNISNEEASIVYASNGEIIGKYFAENRTNIKWEELPDNLVNALIATEDKRYFEHEGYDVYSYFRVFFKTLLLGDRSSGGGSTITQQLVKNLYGRNDYGKISIVINKLRETIIAKRLEDVYSKEEILLLYFNSVTFGEDVYGIESAAQRFFNKSTSALSIEESATLVGLLKANTYYNPHKNPDNSFQRRNIVLFLMKEEAYISENQYDSLRNIPLRLDYQKLNLDNSEAYFVNEVRKNAEEILQNLNKNLNSKYDLEKDGLKIYTSLDYDLQKIAENSVKKHLSKMQKLLDKELKYRNTKAKWEKSQSFGNDSLMSVKKSMEIVFADSTRTVEYSIVDSLWHYYKLLNSPVLITNPKNGEILSWIGGNNFRFMPYDLVYAQKQIASAFKPVLYSAAFENGFSPCDYLENEVKVFEEYNSWKPQNADFKSTSDTNIAIWYALANSMNLPAVDLYFKLESEKFKEIYNKFNFSKEFIQEPSVALGTLDLSLYEMIRAYSVFANNGKMVELSMINKITTNNGFTIYERKENSKKRVIGKKSAMEINAVLQRAINEGTGQRIRSNFRIKSDLAGKTGTANNYSNAWFFAYTPNIVMGCWAGALSNNMHFNSSNGSGSSLALPIIAKIVSEIEKDSKMKSKYLTDFHLNQKITKSMDCEWYKQKGVRGVINRIFFKIKKDDTKKLKKDKKIKTKINKFFKKAFGKGD